MEAVEQRVVVDVDTDLRHPPLPRPLPRHRCDHGVGQQHIDRGARVAVGLFESRPIGRRSPTTTWRRVRDRRRGGCGASRTVCRPSGAPTPTLSVCRVRTHLHRRRGVCRAVGSDARTPRPAPSGRSSTGRPATHRDVPAGIIQPLGPRSRRRRHGRPTHHRQPARSRSRASASHTSDRSDTALVSRVERRPYPSTPPRPIRNDPRRPTPGSGGRSPHRPHPPNPAPAAPTSPPHPNQPGRTRPTSTANNPAIASPTPRSSITKPLSTTRSTRGKPDTNHPKQGV